MIGGCSPGRMSPLYVNIGRGDMNEDVFNTSLRKFLKRVGITSQREIEKAVRDALASGS
jgi:uncharacterized protein DUF6494